MNDKSVYIEELKSMVRSFCEERDWDQFHNPKDLAIGLITEASELLEHFRFKSPEETLERLNLQKEEISEELSDILFFTLRFSQRFDIDLSSSLKKKIEKNAEKYPVEKSKGSNRKYNESF